MNCCVCRTACTVVRSTAVCAVVCALQCAYHSVCTVVVLYALKCVYCRVCSTEVRLTQHNQNTIRPYTHPYPSRSPARCGINGVMGVMGEGRECHALALLVAYICMVPRSVVERHPNAAEVLGNRRTMAEAGMTGGTIRSLTEQCSRNNEKGRGRGRAGQH